MLQRSIIFWKVAFFQVFKMIIKINDENITEISMIKSLESHMYQLIDGIFIFKKDIDK